MRGTMVVIGCDARTAFWMRNGLRLGSASVMAKILAALTLSRVLTRFGPARVVPMLYGASAAGLMLASMFGAAGEGAQVLPTLSIIKVIVVISALLIAHWTGLSKPIAAVATYVSFPALVPAILYGSLVLGRWALGRSGEITALEMSSPDFAAWVLGSFMSATVVGILGGLFVYAAAGIGSRLLRGRPTA